MEEESATISKNDAEPGSFQNQRADPPPYMKRTGNDPHGTEARPSSTTIHDLRMRYPDGPWCKGDIKAADGAPVSGSDAKEPFFNSIKERDDATLTYILENEYFNANFQDDQGFTPLLAAIEAGSVTAVDLLMRFGANVNDYGIVKRIKRTYRQDAQLTHRTPLQFAAQKGNLTIVKRLLETYHADDALIAPDGELALRLASSNGHREIVDYLPSRRGGGWRRWKAKHKVAMFRAKGAVVGIGQCVAGIFYYLPKILIYDCIYQGIIKSLWKKLKWIWAHRNEIPGLVAAYVRRAMPHIIRFIPDLVKEVCKVIQRIPEVLRIAGTWIWGGITTFGKALGRIMARSFSFLHTLVIAIGTWLRELTLQNVWQGFCYLLRTVFIDAPVSMWNWLKKFEKTLYKMVGTAFGFLGKVAYWIGYGLMLAILFVPKSIYRIIAAFGASAGKAFSEVLVWWNPKR